MERQKQVVHFQAKAGFTTAQSNEHQRRWTEKGWECSNANGRIDRTREHLNFEIVRGGRVQPVDKSRSIPEKFAENVYTVLEVPHISIEKYTSCYKRTIRLFSFYKNDNHVYETRNNT